MKELGTSKEELFKSETKIRQNKIDPNIKIYFLILTIGTCSVFLFIQIFSFWFLYDKVSTINNKFSQENEFIMHSLNSLFNKINHLEETFIEFHLKNNTPQDVVSDRQEVNMRDSKENHKSNKQSGSQFEKFTKTSRPVGPTVPDNMNKSSQRISTKINSQTETSDSKVRLKRQTSSTLYQEGADHFNFRLKENGQRDSSWLQLTSKIPRDIDYKAMQDFCAKTRSSCPPGPQGPPGNDGTIGFPGKKGDRGLRGATGPIGDRGLPGNPGMPGPPGIPGQKGDVGEMGRNGLDGRDGLSGEPGLDGVPGRNGMNGLPGIDGVPGMDGLPGLNGQNGSDGIPGSKGERGYIGPKGSRGIAGPRGRPGKNGTPGVPGTPGLNYSFVNGTKATTVLIPPSIPGSTRNKTKPRKPIIIRENENLRLRCQAAGEPKPLVEWSRVDGGVIPTGQWRDGSLNAPILNLTHIRREHTGMYMCQANNGIPPIDVKTFNVEVHFEPYIRIKQWKVGAFNGSAAHMECHVESFPSPLTYWEDGRGRRLENITDKYDINFIFDNNFVWKSLMTLTIKNITSKDFGNYHCVAKNELSITRGLIKVHEIDPTLYVPSTGTVDGLTFGPDPPNYSELFNDLCPPPSECPACPPPPKRTQGRGSLYCLNVEQLGNNTYPGFKNRTFDCELSAVGKPVYHRHTDSEYGSWMRDPEPKNVLQEANYWATNPKDPYHLYEFVDKVAFRKNKHGKNYTVPYPFMGNSHVVYNGSFIYQKRGENVIISYDLITGTNMSLKVPHLMFSGSNYLYTESHDYIDLATDENGLWAIYGLRDSNNTVVMKLKSWNLQIEYSWNISLSHHKFGEMFITCGVLYGIDSSTERETKIRFALDLYKKNVLDVDLPFNNPFRKTTMLGYNPKYKEIYSWDNGNQLTYPIKYIDIGYNTPYEDRKNGNSAKVLDYETDYEVVKDEGVS